MRFFSADLNRDVTENFDLVAYITDQDEATTNGHSILQQLMPERSIVDEIETTITVNMPYYSIHEPDQPLKNPPIMFPRKDNPRPTQVDDESDSVISDDSNSGDEYASSSKPSSGHSSPGNSSRKRVANCQQSSNTSTTIKRQKQQQQSTERKHSSELASGSTRTSSPKQTEASTSRKADNRRTHQLQHSILMGRSLHSPVTIQRTTLFEPLPADVAQQMQAAALVGVKPPRGSRMRVRSTPKTAPADMIAQAAATANVAASDQQTKKRLNLQEYLQRRRENGEEAIICQPQTPPVQRPIVAAVAVAPPPIPLLFKIPERDSATSATPAAARVIHQLPDPSLKQIVAVSLGCNITASLPCSTASQRAIMTGTCDSGLLQQQQANRHPSATDSMSSSMEEEEVRSSNRWSSRSASQSAHSSRSHRGYSHYRDADVGSASGSGRDSLASGSGYPRHQQNQRQTQLYHGQHPQHRRHPYNNGNRRNRYVDNSQHYRQHQQQRQQYHQQQQHHQQQQNYRSGPHQQHQIDSGRFNNKY